MKLSQQKVLRRCWIPAWLEEDRGRTVSPGRAGAEGKEPSVMGGVMRGPQRALTQVQERSQMEDCNKKGSHRVSVNCV